MDVRTLADRLPRGCGLAAARMLVELARGDLSHSDLARSRPHLFETLRKGGVINYFGIEPRGKMLLAACRTGGEAQDSPPWKETPPPAFGEVTGRLITKLTAARLHTQSREKEEINPSWLGESGWEQSVSWNWTKHHNFYSLSLRSGAEFRYRVVVAPRRADGRQPDGPQTSPIPLGLVRYQAQLLFLEAAIGALYCDDEGFLEPGDDEEFGF